LGVKISSIIFLGTAGDSFVVSRQLRAAGGLVIQLNDMQFHIDPGPGSLVMAKQCGVNLRANTALLVSNSQLYNSNDINAVIDAMTYAGFDKKGVLIAPRSVINGSENKPTLLLPFYRDCLERYIALDPGQRVGLDNVEIQALKTYNDDFESIGFKFFAPEFTISYLSDTKYSKDLVEQCKNSNILILNVIAPKKEDSKNSLSSEDAVNLIREVNPRLAIISHFGLKMIESDPLYEVREIQKKTGVQVIAAKDSLVINPVSYAVQQGQKTLQSFPKKEQEIKVEGPREEVEDAREKAEPEKKDFNDVFVNSDQQ